MVLRLWHQSLRLKDTKILKKVKNLKLKFRDLQLCLNQIDHEESENHNPNTLGCTLKAPGPLFKGFWGLGAFIFRVDSRVSGLQFSDSI